MNKIMFGVVALLTLVAGAQEKAIVPAPEPPVPPPVFRPTSLRENEKPVIVETDGEEAFYGHRRTSSGGFVSEDVTTGYGPEEYLRKNADKGVYKILANYFASHQQSLTGAATVTATVYTGWGTDHEKREIISFRLDKPKDKHPIGEIKIDGEKMK